MIRVWIETTSAVARAGLRVLLERAEGIEMAAHAEEAEVVIRDETAVEAGEGRHPVVALGEGVLTRQMAEAGVRVALSREAGAEQLAAGVYAAAAGLMAAPAEAGGIVVAADGGGAMVEALTARETEVLEMLAEGLSNKEIAGRLGISDHTAKFHVNSILGKMGAGTRTEAVTKGIRRGIVKV